MNKMYLLVGIIGVIGVWLIAGIVTLQFMQQQSDRNYEYCIDNFWEMNHNYVAANESTQQKYCEEKYK